MTASTVDRPQLTGTPLSHFTRKVRILFAELDVDFEMKWHAGVLDTARSAYADNPLLRVPALVCGSDTIIESEHIARFIVGRYDPADRLDVRSERVEAMNQLAVMNGVMANEVTLILSQRAGVADLDAIAYFRKLKLAIGEALGWLDARVDVERGSFDWRDVVLVCMWQHLKHYRLLPLEHPRVRARVARFADRPSVASTNPHASLAEATAAGWRPA